MPLEVSPFGWRQVINPAAPHRCAGSVRFYSTEDGDFGALLTFHTAPSATSVTAATDVHSHASTDPSCMAVPSAPSPAIRAATTALAVDMILLNLKRMYEKRIHEDH